MQYDIRKYLEGGEEANKRIEATRNDDKPYKGRIADWVKTHCNPAFGLGYIIEGIFIDHPQFAGMHGHTSYIVKHNEETGEIETRNSIYTLVK